MQIQLCWLKRYLLLTPLLGTSFVAPVLLLSLVWIQNLTSILFLG